VSSEQPAPVFAPISAAPTARNLLLHLPAGAPLPLIIGLRRFAS
jgi:hypothetical protein